MRATLVVLVVAMSLTVPFVAVGSASAESCNGQTVPAAYLGTSSDDLFHGSTGDNVMDGIQGDDTIGGNGGGDTICGGSGTDILAGDNYFSGGSWHSPSDPGVKSFGVVYGL